MTNKKYTTSVEKLELLSADLLQATIELLEKCEQGDKVESIKDLVNESLYAINSALDNITELREKVIQINELEEQEEVDEDDDETDCDEECDEDCDEECKGKCKKR